jgi:hypothetical protein
MKTIGDDTVVRVTLVHAGKRYSTQWYYNLSVRESVKRSKRVHGLTGKHGVTVLLT